MLTPNGATNLYRGMSAGFHPTLQVNEMQTMQAESSGEVYTVVGLSDGEKFAIGILPASALSNISGEIKINSIVQILQWAVEQKQQGHTLIHVSQLRHLGPYDQIIGDPSQADPSSLGSVGNANDNTQPAAPGALEAIAQPPAQPLAQPLAQHGQMQAAPPGVGVPHQGQQALQQPQLHHQQHLQQHGQQQPQQLQQPPQLHQQQSMMPPPQQQQQQQQQQQTAPAGQAYGGAVSHSQYHWPIQGAVPTMPPAAGAPAPGLPPAGQMGTAVGSHAHAAAARPPQFQQQPQQQPLHPAAQPQAHQPATAAAAAPASMAPWRQAPSASVSGGGVGFGGFGRAQAAAPSGYMRAAAQAPYGQPGQQPTPASIPIRQLSPYNPRWRITARVVKKGAVKTFRYKQRDEEGKMFNVELADAEGGETRATFFGRAVDTFFEVLAEKRVYTFGGGRVKRGDPKWTTCEHEITFDEHAKIAEVEDDGQCAHLVVNPKPLAVIETSQVGSSLDLVAIVIAPERPVDVTLQTGEPRKRSNATLLDDSGASIRLSLWGPLAELPFVEGEPAVFRSVKINSYGGRSLSTNYATTILLGQEAALAHPRVNELNAWFRGQGGAAAKDGARALTGVGGGGGPALTIMELKAEAAQLEVSGGAGFPPAGGGPTVKYHTVMPATVTFLPHDRAPFYMSCPYLVPDDKAGEGKTRSCNKKVEQSPEGWCCQAGHCSPAPCPRWMAQFAIADQSGTQYVSTFDEVGQKLLGCQAAEAAHLWERKEADPESSVEFERRFRAPLFKRWRMRLKCIKEIWNDEERLKVTVVDCQPVNWVSDGRSMAKDILAALGQEAHLPAEASAGA
eukprot:TRINITY_DN5337_c0_g1_i1.p1 TRINITY_DN5337_c0_g1~~TRINITY_DN5337_c0_g1_i1.p1  ORF type:complete len:844 (+),score=238.98 TRINITY_DN5337_c0_g1_i1:165-2696(+)